MPPDDLPQVGDVDGLGHVVVAAGVEAALAVAGHGVGRQGDDRGRPAVLPKPFGGLDAVHVGHLDVHQNDLVRPPCRQGMDGLVAAGAAAAGNVHLQAGAAKHDAHNVLHVGAFLDQQHTASKRRRGRIKI